jgi:DNA methylase
MPEYPDAAARPNAICPYYTMFPLAFPWHVLSGARRNARVLDPFCGRGTTAYAARLLGLASVGIDTNPVAVAIARAKLIKVRPSAIVARCKQLLATQVDVPVPQGDFWPLAYHPSTLKQISRLREVFARGCSQPVDVVLRALVLGILHGPRTKGRPSYLSNQMPRTYATKPDSAVRFWREHSLSAPEVDVAEAVERRVKYTLADQPPSGTGRIALGDSRRVSLDRGIGPFDFVVTSPPYYGMYTYYPDQWLRAWLLGGPANPTESGIVQLGHGTRTQFVASLALVWRRIAAVSRPGAQLAIRFGSLPSAPVDPEWVIRESLNIADVGWNVKQVSGAGETPRGRRQADQFLDGVGEMIDEVDVYATMH